jgi:hypothetical protein
MNRTIAVTLLVLAIVLFSLVAIQPVHSMSSGTIFIKPNGSIDHAQRNVVPPSFPIPHLFLNPLAFIQTFAIILVIIAVVLLVAVALLVYLLKSYPNKKSPK